MVHDLTACFLNCVNRVATTKVITEHSRPWINRQISEQLKLLRLKRKKCRLRKSPVNVADYQKTLQETDDMIKKAEQEWWLSECQKLTDANDSTKWKIIRRLTHQINTVGIQPIRKYENGNPVYMFEDDDIRNELENFHIRRVQDSGVQDSTDCNMWSTIANMVTDARSGRGNSLMNDSISDYEIKCTFGKGSDTPGPDGISAKLVDKADRGLMHCCLGMLWKRAWDDGVFVSDWKLENRVVIPKPGKDDYNDCNSYRTISITSCLGKRFEYITCQRLVSVLESANFDPDQFAYIKHRRAT